MIGCLGDKCRAITDPGYELRSGGLATFGANTRDIILVWDSILLFLKKWFSLAFQISQQMASKLK